jgi:hypothetical protein
MMARFMAKARRKVAQSIFTEAMEPLKFLIALEQWNGCWNHRCKGGPFKRAQLRLCAKCGAARYCSRKCQGEDWEIGCHESVCGNRGLDGESDVGFGPSLNESSFIVSNEEEEMLMALEVPNGAPLPFLFPEDNVFENFSGALSDIVGASEDPRVPAAWARIDRHTRYLGSDRATVSTIFQEWTTSNAKGTPSTHRELYEVIGPYGAPCSAETVLVVPGLRMVRTKAGICITRYLVCDDGTRAISFRLLKLDKDGLFKQVLIGNKTFKELQTGSGGRGEVGTMDILLRLAQEVGYARSYGFDLVTVRADLLAARISQLICTCP